MFKPAEVLVALSKKNISLPSGEEIKIQKSGSQPYLAVKQGGRWTPYVNITFNEFLELCDRIPEEALKTPVKVFDEEFEAEFWPLTYRKDAIGNARKAYRAARKKAEKGDILNAWKQANAQWKQRGERQFTPMPATWLNQERWLNEEFLQPESSVDNNSQTKGLQTAIGKELQRIGYTAKLPEQFSQPGIATYFDLVSKSIETAREYLEWLKVQPIGVIW